MGQDVQHHTRLLSLDLLPPPERIPHSSKRQDSKVYQVHDLRVSEIYRQAVTAENVGD